MKIRDRGKGASRSSGGIRSPSRTRLSGQPARTRRRAVSAGLRRDPGWEVVRIMDGRWLLRGRGGLATGCKQTATRGCSTFWTCARRGPRSPGPARGARPADPRPAPPRRRARQSRLTVDVLMPSRTIGGLSPCLRDRGSAPRTCALERLHRPHASCARRSTRASPLAGGREDGQVGGARRLGQAGPRCSTGWRRTWSPGPGRDIDAMAGGGPLPGTLKRLREQLSTSTSSSWCAGATKDPDWPTWCGRGCGW